MIKTQKIKGRMAEKGYTYSSLAALMNMSKVTLSKKIKGDGSFTVQEANQLGKLLDFCAQEMIDIFLS